MERRKLYTLGYTLFQNGVVIDIEKMFKTLKEFNVTHLIDVRSMPYSKQYPQCNADNLKVASKHFSISYGHMPELGAKASPTQDVFSKATDIFFESIFPISKSNRPEDTELYADDEIVDFQKFRKDEYFSVKIGEYSQHPAFKDKTPVPLYSIAGPYRNPKATEPTGDILHLFKRENAEKYIF